MLQRFDISKLRENSDNVRLFMLDIVMIGLALLYLIWSLFDMLVRTKVLGGLLLRTDIDWLVQSYHAYTAFDSIFYDTLFVAIFMAELFFRWGLAIYRKTYHRWFFYPFVHWYDTLGCIPVTSFKFFRVLRIFFVGQRLHQEGILDLSGTFVYEILRKYSKVIVEEVSDRVVINIISGMQAELQRGTPVADQVVQEVIAPHKTALVTWAAHRVQYAAQHTQATYGTAIRAYVDGVIEEAVHNNNEVGQIERIPLLGNRVGLMLEKAISDIVNQVIARALEDLGSAQNREVINGAADMAIDSLLFHESDAQLDQIVKDIANRSLEMLKTHVKVQQWKREEQQEEQ